MKEFEERSTLIKEILEQADEIFSHTASFDATSELRKIQQELYACTGEKISDVALQTHLDKLWADKEIVKLITPLGLRYRSRTGEILRNLYKLKLWTKRGETERIYQDVSQIKYARVPAQGLAEIGVLSVPLFNSAKRYLISFLIRAFS